MARCKVAVIKIHTLNATDKVIEFHRPIGNILKLSADDEELALCRFLGCIPHNGRNYARRAKYSLDAFKAAQLNGSKMQKSTVIGRCHQYATNRPKSLLGITIEFIRH